MALYDAGNQHDEGAGRPANLETAAAERRYQEASDNGGVEPLVRRQAGTDRDRHGQRQRHDGHGQAGHRVGPQARPAIALAQNGHELGREQLGEGGLRPGKRSRHFHKVRLRLSRSGGTSRSIIGGRHP